jgi:predicted RNA-binding protein associated with RNAse of E/G family
MDLTLDLVIAPDRKRWQWKDEDEFAFGIQHGWYTEQQMADLKEYGQRVIDDATHGRPPFDAGWEHWRPPPDWEPLELPDGWDA